MKFILFLNILLIVNFGNALKNFSKFEPNSKSMDNFIYRGVNATPCEARYIVRVLVSTTSGYVYFCGGTLLNSRQVLTAAHCLMDLLVGSILESVKIRYGSNYYDEGKEIEMESFKKHINYEIGSLIDDIAVITLKKDIIESFNVMYVKLRYEVQQKKTQATAFGWGPLSGSTDGHANYLQKAKLNVTITENVIAFPIDRAEPGPGDSGGPIIDKSGRQIGVIKGIITDAYDQNKRYGYAVIVSKNSFNYIFF